MLYYAFVHAYGATTCDRAGKDIGHVEIFARKAERDSWVDQGPEQMSESGYREALSTNRAYAHLEYVPDYPTIAPCGECGDLNSVEHLAQAGENLVCYVCLYKDAY